jgi:hypothetical protein
MRVVAHCFAENALIIPSRFNFKFKDFDASIYSIEKQLTLEISKIMTPEELELFSINKQSENNEEGITHERLHKKLEPYKIVLTEAAHLLEGIFSLMYQTVPPHFDTFKTYVNLYSQTDEEQKLLDEGSISRGGGYLISNGVNKYHLDNSILELIEPSIYHLTAFSFFSTALRSLKSNDNEVAFFLFFRIIDGYFAHGAKDVEKELLKSTTDVQRFIPYDPTLISSIKTIISEMGLPSKSEKGFDGLISDIVLIRHKLTHFSSSKSKSHHSAKIKMELLTVNNYLYNCCFHLIRERLGDDIKK